MGENLMGAPGYNILRTSFWNDPRVRHLRIDAKGLLSYLETGPHSSYWGIYHVHPLLIPLESGVTPEEAGRCFKIFQTLELAWYDPVHQVVFVQDHLDIIQRLSPTQQTGLVKHLSTLGPTPLVGKFLKRYSYLEIPWNRPISTQSIPYGYPIDTKGLGLGFGVEKNSLGAPANAVAEDEGSGQKDPYLKEPGCNAEPEGEEPKGEGTRDKPGNGNGAGYSKDQDQPAGRGRGSRNTSPDAKKKTPQRRRIYVDDSALEEVYSHYAKEVVGYGSDESALKKRAFKFIKFALSVHWSVAELCTAVNIFADNGGAKAGPKFRTRCHTFFNPKSGDWSDYASDARKALKEVSNA